MSHSDLLADGVMSVAEAAAFGRLSRAELYSQMSAGRLVYVQHGRRRLIPRRAMIAMLAQGLAGTNHTAQQTAAA